MWCAILGDLNNSIRHATLNYSESSIREANRNENSNSSLSRLFTDTELMSMLKYSDFVELDKIAPLFGILVD